MNHRIGDAAHQYPLQGSKTTTAHNSITINPAPSLPANATIIPASSIEHLREFLWY
jgi:hypothetical protein